MVAIQIKKILRIMQTITLFIILANASSAQQCFFCEDPDQYNPHIKSTCNSTNNWGTDFCVNNDILIEFYCKDCGIQCECGWTPLSCQEINIDSYCENGTCITTTSSSTTSTTSSTISSTTSSTTSSSSSTTSTTSTTSSTISSTTSSTTSSSSSTTSTTSSTTSTTLCYRYLFSGICESPGDCECLNLALNDDERCYNEVRMYSDVKDSAEMMCINNPENFTKKTLNCNHHELDAQAINTNQHAIYLNGRENPEIINCEIKDWNHGIYLKNTENATIKQNEIRDNHFGVYLAKTKFSRITNNSLHHNTYTGLNMYESRGNLISENQFTDQGDDGLYIHTKSEDNQIQDNLIYRNQRWGVMIQASKNTLNNNNITYNARDGLILSDPYNWTTNNNINHNYVCFNNQTESNYYDIRNNNKHNQGDENTCDTHQNWDDEGTLGCTHPCTPTTTSTTTTSTSTTQPFECYAEVIVDYSPGNRTDGSPLAYERANASKALGEPQDNDTQQTPINFASLGLNGSVTLGFNQQIINQQGDDFKVFETTYSGQTCQKYPEKISVYASENQTGPWNFLGIGCLDSWFDLGSLSWASYIKLEDTTNQSQFKQTIDGYDVDAVAAKTCQIPETTTTTTL
ncbi:MAG: hypothetical protein GF334_11500, partial [Candidatus Altiarchaeales archaeon]|nr:hypothetical protein [Candidatus Altiarchaeales archaeon]